MSGISWGDGTVEDSSGAGEAWTACFGPPPRRLPLWICLGGSLPRGRGPLCGGALPRGPATAPLATNPVLRGHRARGGDVASALSSSAAQLVLSFHIRSLYLQPHIHRRASENPPCLRTWAKGEGQGRLICPDLIAWEASEEKPVRPRGGVELLPAFVG